MNAVIQFGRIPYSLLEARLRHFKNSELLVYIEIARHVDERWTARVSYKRIAKITGLCERTVMRTVDQLERKCLITVVRGGGSGICNRYTLVTKLDYQAAESRNANGDAQAVTFSPAENGDKSTRKPRRARLRNMTAVHRKPVTLSVTRTDEQSEQTNTPAANTARMVGVDGQAELLRTLTSHCSIAGHNAPKLIRAIGRLAEPWTAQRIRAIDTQIREGGGRTGAVYKVLRAELAQELRRQHRAAFERIQVDRRRTVRLAQVRQERAEFERSKRETQAIIDGLSDAELAEEKARAFARLPTSWQVECKGQDPRDPKNRLLRAIIVEKYKFKQQER